MNNMSHFSQGSLLCSLSHALTNIGFCFNFDMAKLKLNTKNIALTEIKKSTQKQNIAQF